jgi:hypothetical protein
VRPSLRGSPGGAPGEKHGDHDSGSSPESVSCAGVVVP